MTIEYPLWFTILVYINLYFGEYWYALFPAMASAIPLILVRMFAFPLLTRNPAELIIIFGPTKARVIKVTSKVLPFFTFKNNLYWFAEPIEVGHNLLHIYVEGVNQPITNLERNPDKEANMLSLREFTKQTTSHNIIIPPSMKSFIRSWVLIVKGGKVELKTASEAGVKGKQLYRLGVFKRIGLYMMKEVEVEAENSSSSAKELLQTVTVQMIQQKIGNIVKGTNFSSRYAFKILKRARYVEINWINMLTGAFDMRMLLIIGAVIIVFILIFFVFKPGDISSLGPPPAGLGGK